MEARRKLIVVSNRGPVSYRRGDGGERIEQRGQGGLVTALRPLVAHHDVTWVASAMTDEDRAVAAEAGGSALEVTGRTGETYRLRLVTHDHADLRPLLQPLREPDALVPPALPLESRRGAGQRSAPARRVVELRGGRTSRSQQPFSRSSTESPTPRSGSTTTTSTLRRGSSASARPDALLSHFVHIPWPGPDYWTVLPEPVRRGDPRRAARERRGRLPHRPLARELPRLGGAHPRRGGRPRARHGRARRPADARHRPSDLGRPGRVRGACRQRGGARAGARPGARSPASS